MRKTTVKGRSAKRPSNKKKPGTRSRQALPVHVRNRADYESLTHREQEARHRAFQVVSRMRRKGLSLSAAAHQVGTTPETVRRHASEALVQEGRRWRVTPSDRSYQRMSVLSIDGLRDIDVRGSRVRSLAGRHWNAIGRFAATGDVSVLAPFVGRSTGGVLLATDPDLLEEYLRSGDLDIDDIYV
jgi:hypothetical protein